PVLGQHHEPEARVGANGLADLLGEGEARPDVGDPRGRVAEALADQQLAVRAARKDVDRIRMRVVDVRRGHERVGVSIELRGPAGSSMQRATWATISSSLISSRAASGST